MSKLNKWDEITQLQIAYDALKTQPYDVQIRMLAWLESKCHSDHAEAMKARSETGRRNKEKAK